jgi:hypothetical protein
MATDPNLLNFEREGGTIIIPRFPLPPAGRRRSLGDVLVVALAGPTDISRSVERLPQSRLL